MHPIKLSNPCVTMCDHHSKTSAPVLYLPVWLRIDNKAHSLHRHKMLKELLRFNILEERSLMSFAISQMYCAFAIESSISSEGNIHQKKNIHEKKCIAKSTRSLFPFCIYCADVSITSFLNCVGASGTKLLHIWHQY